MLDICMFSPELSSYLLKTTSRKYTKLLVIHSTNLIGSIIVFLMGSELKYIVYM